MSVNNISPMIIKNIVDMKQYFEEQKSYIMHIHDSLNVVEIRLENNRELQLKPEKSIPFHNELKEMGLLKMNVIPPKGSMSLFIPNGESMNPHPANPKWTIFLQIEMNSTLFDLFNNK